MSSAPASPSAPSPPIRVMLVADMDSAVAKAVVPVLEGDPRTTVVARPANGNIAAPRLKREAIDVVILDAGLPETVGINCLKNMLTADPDAKVLLATELNFRNVKVGSQGLLQGAADFIAVPTPFRRLGEVRIDRTFRSELLELVLALGRERRRKTEGRRCPPEKRAPLVLREPGLIRPEVVAIAASTGGPEALIAFFRRLPKTVRQPIVITQHMPTAFTRSFAENINRFTPWECHEARNGERLEGGRIYLAPGGHHLLVEGLGTARRVRLGDQPAANGFKPSADPMLESLARACHNRVLAAVFTGMGKDGLEGARALVAAGGTVIVQDEDTSVVWGMPGAVATAGLCSAILPLKEMAPWVRKFATQRR